MKAIDYNETKNYVPNKAAVRRTAFAKQAIKVCDSFGGYALIGNNYVLVDMKKFNVVEK